MHGHEKIEVGVREFSKRKKDPFGFVFGLCTNLVLLSAAMPIKNNAGAIVGSILVGRELDDNFLDGLDFARREGVICIEQGENGAAPSRQTDVLIGLRQLVVGSAAR